MKQEKYTYVRPEHISRYKKQLAFMDAPERYVIIEATTKAGKTTGCLVWLFEQAMTGGRGLNYWWVAPTRMQARVVFDRLLLYIPYPDMYKTNKSNLTVKLANGATIFFKSADRPDGMYGEDVTAVVIDEASRLKEDAWAVVQSTLTKTMGRAKIIGNVQGIHNWAYKLARLAEAGQLPDWKYFKITADDAVQAGILEQKAIDAAKATLPTGKFLELYYGIPDQTGSNKFCYAFDEATHIGKCTLYREEWVYLSFDFNHNPICCSAYQVHHSTLFCLRTFKLPNSNIYNLCKEIKLAFPYCKFIVTGDATGKNITAIVEDQINYYRIIQQKLNINDRQLLVPHENPPLHKNQVRVNSVLEHYKVIIDPDHAADMIYDMKFVEVNPDGTLKKKNRNDPKQQADLLDTFRYMCNNIMPQFYSLSNFD